MQIVIVYFSQTGNTLRIADALADSFRESGNPARVISITELQPEDLIEFDILGVGAPCFSSKAPTPLIEFLDELPTLKEKPAFVFATSGGAPGRVLYDLANSLRRKNANVVGGFLARGEVHHPAPALNGRFPGRPNAEDLAQARKFAEALSTHLDHNESDPLPGNRRDILKPGLGFYDLVSLASLDATLRFFLPEPKLTLERCDQCLLCVYECPMANITMEPYPVLGDKCIRCYRCYNVCHLKAFSVNWKLGNLLLSSMYNTTFVRWFGDLQSGEQIY
jgi:flavodoxin/NAD-dependent dihydropyrimidine dehydrogenase PreA subunit